MKSRLKSAVAAHPAVRSRFPLLARAIKAVFDDGSVTSLFDGRYGLATLCVGAGMGIATVIERV